MVSLFYPLYKDDLSFIVVAVLWAFPAVMKAVAFAVSKKFRVRISELPRFIPRGEKLSVKVRMRNSSFLPSAGCTVKLMYKTCSESKYRNFDIDMPVKARSVEMVAADITPVHCGEVKIKINQASVCDFMGIVSHKIKLDKEYVSIVMPREIPVPQLALLTGIVPENEYSVKMQGGNPPNVSGIREYREGDRMNRIHWKLSTRSEELIAKEFEEFTPVHILIIPDISACLSRDESDLCLDAFYSVLKEAAKNECRCSVYLTKEDVPEIKAVQSEDDVTALMYELLSDAKICGEMSDTASFMQSMQSTESMETYGFTANAFSHIITFTPREKKEILTELEITTGCKNITVFCTGNAGDAGEDKHSDVIVYNIRKGDTLSFPEIYTEGAMLP